jgi:hypothetical protein
VGWFAKTVVIIALRGSEKSPASGEIDCKGFFQRFGCCSHLSINRDGLRCQSLESAIRIFPRFATKSVKKPTNI